MQEQELAMNQVAPTGRTRRRVAKSMLAGSIIALGLVAANTSIAQASTTAGDGVQTHAAAQSTIHQQDFNPCVYNPDYCGLIITTP